MPITATDYCEYLNAIAKTDFHHLYDEKMGADPEAACILRSGVPENFYYNVIAGRENEAVPYLNYSACATLLQKYHCLDESDDKKRAKNLADFYFDMEHILS